MRPSNKTWSLTVRAGSLHLDAPHGSFEVRGIAPEVRPTIDALPDGTDVECEGSFDGGGTITHLVVTKIRRILKDLTGRVMTLPDAIIAADGRLAAARARKHFADGNVDAAAADIGAMLRIGDDQAIAELERLPPAHQQQLLAALVEWQAPRVASWRALRHIPLARWTEAHLDQAFDQSLTNGGVFGAAPGTRAEAILDELERRERSTTSRVRLLRRLRKAQSTEGDTYHRITTELDDARVVGADMTDVYVAGTAKLGESVEQQGAKRKRTEDRRPVIVRYALDGGEQQRWIDVRADRVVDGIAIRLDDDPAGTRLSDGKVLYQFAHRIMRDDGELLWGIHARDPEKRTMRSEIVRLATGDVMARFDEWIDNIAWDEHGVTTSPPKAETIRIETTRGVQTLPHQHAPWLFGGWQSVNAGGWVVHYDTDRQLYLAPAELDATWVSIELTAPAQLDLAPPWLAFRADGPIVLVALAELMSAAEIRIDGKRFAKRGGREPAFVVAPAIVAWFDKLVETGLAPKLAPAQRDAHLHRALGDVTTPGRYALEQALLGLSDACLAHRDHWIDRDDDVFATLTRMLGNVEVREVERRENTEGSPDLDDPNEVTLTVEVTYNGKRVRRMCGWGIDAAMTAVDKMLERVGSPRRIFAIEADRSYRRSYLVMTPAQRRALVAANVEGISAGP